ncbi:MAG: hypothetical protein EZS28_041665, partial [Streblomastix strix]
MPLMKNILQLIMRDSNQIKAILILGRTL